MSSVIDYFTSGISDTYNETVDYWSKENSVADAVDVVVWSANNTDTVVEATKKGINKSTQELKVAVKQDTNKMLLIGAIALGTYFYFKKGGK